MNGLQSTTGPLSPAQAALQRLMASRAQLGRALGHSPDDGRSPGLAGPSAPQGSAGVSTSARLPRSATTPMPPSSTGLLARLASQGVVKLLANRWRQSPGGASLQLAGQAADGLLRPVAQRHPVQLVLAAGAVGGLAMLVKPWRWLPTTGLLALWPLAGRAIVQAALQQAGRTRAP